MRLQRRVALLQRRRLPLQCQDLGLLAVRLTLQLLELHLRPMALSLQRCVLQKKTGQVNSVRGLEVYGPGNRGESPRLTFLSTWMSRSLSFSSSLVASWLSRSHWLIVLPLSPGGVELVDSSSRLCCSASKLSFTCEVQRRRDAVHV